MSGSICGGADYVTRKELREHIKSKDFPCTLCYYDDGHRVVDGRSKIYRDWKKKRGG
jgi:hypothetical protein